MSGGGGGGTSTTVQKADPWAGAQPGLSALYGNAVANYNLGNLAPTAYPGVMVAGMTGEQEAALRAGFQRSVAGSPLVANAKAINNNAATGAYLNSNPLFNYFNEVALGKGGTNPTDDYLKSVMGGSFLGENPYLADMVKAANRGMSEQYSDSVLPGVASMFSSGGRMGSGALMDALASSAKPLANAMSDNAARIYGGAYDAERNRMQQAAGQLSGNFQFDANRRDAAAGTMSDNYNFERGLQQQAVQFAPTLANQDYVDLDKMLGIGEYRQAHMQDLIDAEMARYNQNVSRPLTGLQNLSSLMTGGMNFGTTSTQSRDSAKRNPFMGAIGGAMVGSALGGAAGGAATGSVLGPWGMAAGALLGGLFG